MRIGGILLFVGIGFLFILIGIQGNLGSVLGAIIDPGSMQASSGAGGGTVTVTGGQEVGIVTVGQGQLPAQ